MLAPQCLPAISGTVNSSCFYNLYCIALLHGTLLVDTMSLRGKQRPIVQFETTSSQFRAKFQNGRWLASHRSPLSAGTEILLLNNSQAISTAQMIWIYSWFNKDSFEDWELPIEKLLFDGLSSKSLQWVRFVKMPNAQLQIPNAKSNLNWISYIFLGRKLRPRSNHYSMKSHRILRHLRRDWTGLNPLSPKSDQHQIFPCNSNAL